MKTAVELYEAFLIEMDRHESPDAQVVDFLQHWNTAVYSFIENELTGFEATNTVSDRLRTISTKKDIQLNAASCNAPKKSVAIPTDHYRLFGVRGVFEFARDFGLAYAKGDLIPKPFKKMTADLDGFISDNKYYKPSIKNPFYQILDNEIQFIYDDGLTNSSHIFIRDVTLFYVKHPVPLQLSDDFTNFTSSPFPIDVNRLILKIAVLGYMGTTGDQRAQLKSQL